MDNKLQRKTMLATALRDAEASGDDYATAEAISEVCAELDLPPNETEQGLTQRASDLIDEFLAAYPTRSYAPEVIADASGKWAGNDLRFATAAEAAEWVEDLGRRWTLVRDTRVVGSGEPVKDEMVDGELRRIQPKEAVT